MDFLYSAKTSECLKRLGAFMDEHIYPNEERFEAQPSSRGYGNSAWRTTSSASPATAELAWRQVEERLGG